MSAALLEARGLAVGYRHEQVLGDLDLVLRAGELVCLLGANGAGKSTLMRTLTGMQPPLGGRVWVTVSGVSCPLASLTNAERARTISAVLTERIDADMTAYDLVTLGRHPYSDWLDRLSEADHARVAWALQAVGAAELAGRRVRELSDGERQRIVIARALAQDTPLLFLDEPTAFLDFPNRVEIMQRLRHLVREGERAILLSTHDLDLALRCADRLWLLADGQIHAGTPEDLALSGIFDRAFDLGGIASFDLDSGAFSARAVPNGRRVCIEGSGARLLWTQRALERVGFTSADDAPLVIKVGQGEWCVIAADGVKHAATIAELLMLLGA